MLDLSSQTINFLNATGGTFVKRLGAKVGEIQLAAYLRDDLLMSADELQLFGQTIRQQIKLKHLEALWTLLQSLTNVDVFAKVQVQYTALLTPELSALITVAAPALELDALLPTFKEFILAQLTVRRTNASYSVSLPLELARSPI